MGFGDRDGTVVVFLCWPGVNPQLAELGKDLEHPPAGLKISLRQSPV
jgi:hypothetical protein